MTEIANRDDTQGCGAEGDLPSLEYALQQLQRNLPSPQRFSQLPLRRAAGRVLAQDIRAGRPLPPWDNSAVDGYAFYHRDLTPGAAALPVIGTAAAGRPLPRPVPPGAALRIFTGAAIPPGPGNTPGPDSVAMQEDCAATDGHVVIPPGIQPGANLRPAGEDISPGDIALTAGTRLDARHLAVAAALGLRRLPVYDRLRTAVLSCGDELRRPGAKLPYGAIYDSNRAMLMALLENPGVTVRDLGLVPDDPKHLESTLRAAAEQYDLLICSGGMSVGAEDHMAALLRRDAPPLFHRLAIKPGRPVGAGSIRRAADGGTTPLIGLPGNPGAVFITFLLLVRPAVLQMTGENAAPPRRWPVTADFTMRKRPGRREFLRARLYAAEGENTWLARRCGPAGAAILSGLRDADGLIDLPEATTRIHPGDRVDFLPFDGLLR